MYTGGWWIPKCCFFTALIGQCSVCTFIWVIVCCVYTPIHECIPTCTGLPVIKKEYKKTQKSLSS